MENLSICQKDSKKKRKNKKKRRAGPKVISSEDHDNDDDEITRTVKLVDRMFGTSTGCLEPSAQSENVNTSFKRSLLSVQYKNLNPQVEIKRMFGKIVNQEQQKKRRTGGTRTLKSYMTNPKESWPVNRNGIFMNLVSAPDVSPTNDKMMNDHRNTLYFSFEHCKLFSM